MYIASYELIIVSLFITLSCGCRSFRNRLLQKIIPYNFFVFCCTISYELASDLRYWKKKIYMAIKISNEKFKFKKFNGMNNFCFSQVKVRDLLIQQHTQKKLLEKPEFVKEWLVGRHESPCPCFNPLMPRGRSPLQHFGGEIHEKPVDKMGEPVHVQVHNELSKLKQQSHKLSMKETTSIHDHMNEFNK